MEQVSLEDSSAELESEASTVEEQVASLVVAALGELEEELVDLLAEATATTTT